jgi:magnesium chelatase subunit H
MPKRISAADQPVAGATPVRVTIVTLDNHAAGAFARARMALRQEMPGLELSLHAATEFGNDEAALERCRQDIEQADIVFACMLFLEDHIQAVLPWLQARRERCDAMVACISATEVVKLTRMGRFDMQAKQSGPMALLKRLKPKRESNRQSDGARQMTMLRRLPKILRFVPGPAQDLRAYFLAMQYWLAGSDENIANMVRWLVNRYAAGPRAELKGKLDAKLPVEHPDLGLYHPRLKGRVTEDLARLPRPAKGAAKGTVGLLVMRSYVLAGDSGHYDGVIAALEARGLNVVPAFASGLDARPAVERYFFKDGMPAVDAVVSLTGFSLVGGPAYNDAKAAEDMLGRLDVPYIAAHALEFQTLGEWEASDRGLQPVEATMMVAIPELDGSTGPMIYGGRPAVARGEQAGEMRAHDDRAALLAARVDRLVALRKSERAERKVAIILFNFPPNAGATGTAAYLSVFASVMRTLEAMRQAGYTVDVPASEDELRERLLGGNAATFGADANVFHRIPVDDHVRREPHLAEIESAWGPAPGRQLTDGQNLFVLGEQFGNVFIGIQPGFGYEGDPMRLLFEKGFAPTHAFSAFYRWLREDYGAHAVLHFGTHGALEFMPGKQAGLSAACWPERLIGDLPNLYLYAANNPSEGTIAKRRAAATLISHLTPPVAHAGLYKGLVELKGSLDRWRGLPPDVSEERVKLAELIQLQASTLELASAEPAWGETATAEISRLTGAVLDLEYTLIPHGLHVIGKPLGVTARADMLAAMAEANGGPVPAREALEALADGASAEAALALTETPRDAAMLEQLRALAKTDRLLAHDHELPAIIQALDGRFVRPVPGGDVLRQPAILPTGRNLHGFDPFRLPSAFAVADGAKQAARLIERHMADGNPLPETVAMVLWGTDNLKSEGGPIAQVLALIGARPRFDSYGRLAGAELVSLEELGRPRIDVAVTLSGIFRDLLPLQTRLLAEACFLAASADEPPTMNFIRRNALAHVAKHGCDLETAALRVFSNADGAYGSNVNQLIDSSAWDDEDELAETYTRRKCFAYGRNGKPVRQAELLGSVLAGVELAYQNLESVELGVTTVDHYFDNLGGISRAVARAKEGKFGAMPVYIGDQTRGDGTVRSLGEQVALETRTRMLNPKWYEGMLEHGYEGVRQIEAHVTNTMGWSATTGQVAPWVYREITQTFVLDPAMRERLAALNPKASAKVANRLLEAYERQYWEPDAATLEALRESCEDLEDRLEGITTESSTTPIEPKVIAPKAMTKEMAA